MRIIKILAISLMCSWLSLGMVVEGIVADTAGVPSRLEVGIAPNPVIAEGSENSIIFVSLQDNLGRPVRASREIALQISSSDLGVGKIPPGSWKIAKDDYYGRVKFSCTMVLEFEPNFIETYRNGSTTITASAEGLISGQAILTTVPPGGSASKLKTYSGVPKIPVSAKSAPIQVQVLDSEGNPTRPMTGFEVTLFASPDLVAFASRSWQWGRDFGGYVSRMEDYARGKAPGLTRITASATGFASESATVEVVPSELTNTATSTYTSAYTATTSTNTQPTSDFDFDILAEPSSASVVAGGSTTFTVTVGLTKGSAQMVDLSATDLPSGAKASFDPSSLFPTDTSTVTIRVPSEVSSGTYKVTFSGISSDLQRSTGVDLVVSGSGCLIATATYGSELAPEIQLLREFRDEKIMPTFAGSNFMTVFNTWYYSFSPSVAGYIWAHQTVRQSIAVVLYPLVGVLHLSSLVYSTFGLEPELAALICGTLASSLIGLMYLSLPVTGLLWFLRRRIDARFTPRIIKWLGVMMVIFLAGFTISQLFLQPQMMMAVAAGIVLTGLSFGSVLPAMFIMKK